MKIVKKVVLLVVKKNVDTSLHFKTIHHANLIK